MLCCDLGAVRTDIAQQKLIIFLQPTHGRRKGKDGFLHILAQALEQPVPADIPGIAHGKEQKPHHQAKCRCVGD